MLLLAAGSSYAQGVKVLSLQDCLNIATDRSTIVLKNNNNVENAGAMVLAAYGQFLPDLSAGAGYNYDHGNNFYSNAGPTVIKENRSAFNYQLTSSLNIFSGFYNYSNWKASKLNQQMATLTLDRAKQQIQLDVTQAYLQLLLDKKIVDLDSANLQTSQRREDQLTMLTDVGRRAKTDLYQQQAQTSNDKLLLINAESRMRNDKVLLFQKLRIDSTEQYEIADMPIDDNADMAAYGNKENLVQQAMKDRVDLQSAELNTQYASWNIKKYRSGYLPKVSLGVGLYNNGAYFNTFSEDDVPNSMSQQSIPYQLGNYTYGLVGVNAVWNIFDKNVTRSNVRMARTAADNARIDLQDTQIAISADVKQAYNDYVNAVQQIETVGAGLTAAQKAYEAVNGRYQEGATDFITESNAQQVLLQAQQNQVQASVNMMLQKKIVDYYVGSIAY